MPFRLFPDRDFLPTLIRIWVPITAQELITSSLNFLGVVMVGQLGDAPVAAVGLANQIFFLLVLTMFGITSGSAIFTAQYWGKRDIQSIHRVLGMCLAMGVAASAAFTVIAVGFPEWALGFYSTDPAVIALGSDYLRIVGLSYVVTAITIAYTGVLRSTETVRLPLAVSGTALTLNMALSYVLIFGTFGFPALGVRGVAIATLVTRYLECAAMLVIVYVTHSPAAAHPRDMLSVQRAFVGRFVRVTFPVTLNETLWSLGITMYNVAYARMGTDSIAAVNVAGAVERMAFVVFIGLSNACAIMVGNRIGANEEEKAFGYARAFLVLGIAGAILLGIVILLTSGAVLALYNISEAAHASARGVLLVLGAVLWVKVLNMFLVVGILRSGGDTRFSFLVDVSSIWMVGVPLAFAGAFVFHLPIYWTVLLATSEEFVKFGVVLARFFSKRWINNLVREPV